MTERRRTRVLVVEDSLLAREGMVAIIRSLPDMLVVGTAADLPSARDAITETAPDVIITDIRMPPGHHDEGVALARELAEGRPELPVIVVSQFCEPDLATRLFARGSRGRGYLLKDRIADPAAMLDAIRSVRSGGTVIDPSIVAGMVVDGRGRGDTALAGLSPREAEVLALVADGRSNGAIANQLGISRKGVEKNVSQIFAKLGLGGGGDQNPRVAATLLWLEGRSDGAPPPGRP